MRRRALGLTLGAVLLSPGIAASADEASLTGSYSGIVACDRTEDGRPGVFQLALQIRVLQEGERLHIATWTAEDEALQRKKPSLYAGKAAVADGMVSGYARVCRPDFAYEELLRILPARAEGGALSFSADTVFVTEALPGREGSLITESCRWVMVRDSAEPPELERCAPE
ncbi:MAG: hypothetical protein AAGE90_04260 [Pseudomonadota bacterium]